MLRECSPLIMCHMSCVTYHMLFGTSHMSHAHVLCHMSDIYIYIHIYIFFFYKSVKLVSGGSVINRAYPV